MKKSFSPGDFEDARCIKNCKNNSQRIIFVIISCQRVFCTNLSKGLGNLRLRFPRPQTAAQIPIPWKRGFRGPKIPMSPRPGNGSFLSEKSPFFYKGSHTQRALRDRLMSRGKNCLPTVSRQFLTRNYPRPNCLLKCLPNCLSPTREGFLSSFKINPAVRVIARQVRDKNCLAAIFAPRHQSVSSGPLGFTSKVTGHFLRLKNSHEKTL